MTFIGGPLVRSSANGPNPMWVNDSAQEPFQRHHQHLPASFSCKRCLSVCVFGKQSRKHSIFKMVFTLKRSCCLCVFASPQSRRFHPEELNVSHNRRKNWIYCQQFPKKKIWRGDLRPKSCSKCVKLSLALCLSLEGPCREIQTCVRNRARLPSQELSTIELPSLSSSVSQLSFFGIGSNLQTMHTASWTGNQEAGRHTLPRASSRNGDDPPGFNERFPDVNLMQTHRRPFASNGQRFALLPRPVKGGTTDKSGIIPLTDTKTSEKFSRQGKHLQDWNVWFRPDFRGDLRQTPFQRRDSTKLLSWEPSHKKPVGLT